MSIKFVRHSSKRRGHQQMRTFGRDAHNGYLSCRMLFDLYFDYTQPFLHLYAELMARLLPPCGQPPFYAHSGSTSE